MRRPPGSPAAVAAGCTCPVMDNRHGAGLRIVGTTYFWREEACPLHGSDLADAPSGVTATGVSADPGGRPEQNLHEKLSHRPDCANPGCSNSAMTDSKWCGRCD